MEWTDELKIETPEQIDVSLEIAGLGSRFYAQVVDWLYKFGLILVVGFVGGLIGVLVGADQLSNTLVAVIGVVAIFFISFGFDIYWEAGQNGQTPGKRSAGIRVIKEGGSPIDFTSACVRNILGLADFLPVGYMLGGFIAMLNARGQRLGDMAAGTIVIRERATSAPVRSLGVAEQLASEEIAFSTQHLARCGAADRHILKAFFQRYHELEPGPRAQLAFRLATQFLARTAYPLDPPLTGGTRPETFLASLYRDLEEEARHTRQFS